MLSERKKIKEFLHRIRWSVEKISSSDGSRRQEDA